MPLPPPEPDTQDWTRVLARPCPECRFVAAEVAVEDLPTSLRANAATWRALLGGPDVAIRPEPQVWSLLEHACHVRDVHRVFGERLRLVLERDEPELPDWDQDATAAGRDEEQDPGEVASGLSAAAEAVAAQYARVPAGAWQRRGLRSGSELTVAGLGRCHLHDVVHHVHDVARVAKAATVAAYDLSAEAYGEVTATMSATVEAGLRRFAATLPAGGRVLEVGSGPGRDATALESHGMSVRRTDISPGFVARLARVGHAADVLDPLTDDLADPERGGAAYDGVWANACLLHVARPDLPVVLGRLAAATRAGGSLHLSLKEGDGEAWSTHGNISAPRLFVYWREGPLRRALEESGWAVDEIGRVDGLRGETWLVVLATRATTTGKDA